MAAKNKKKQTFPFDRRGFRAVSEDVVEKSLFANDGLLYETARKLKITYKTLRNYVKGSKRLQHAVKEAKGRFVDFTKSKLKENVSNNDQGAIQFVLRHMGGKEWQPPVQRTESTETVKVLHVTLTDEMLDKIPLEVKVKMIECMKEEEK
jgi:hypothetical protein